MKQLLITCDHCGDKYAYDYQTIKKLSDRLHNQGWKIGPCGHIHICPKCVRRDIEPADHAKKEG